MDVIHERVVHMELRSLSNRIRRFIDNRPTGQIMKSVTGTHGCIIGYLTENKNKDVFQKDIEREFGVTRSTASKVIDLMEKKDLVKRCKVPYDARLKKLVLTEKSEILSEAMANDMILVEKALIKGFTDEEIDELIGYISRIKNNIEEETKRSKEELK